jgi:hypothetical protein
MRIAPHHYPRLAAIRHTATEHQLGVATSIGSSRFDRLDFYPVFSCLALEVWSEPVGNLSGSVGSLQAAGCADCATQRTLARAELGGMLILATAMADYYHNQRHSQWLSPCYLQRWS